jgi:hypothetical protein
MPKSKEQVFLQAIWKRAFYTGEPFEIEFKTRAGAVRGRLALYNSVKLAKEDRDPDPVVNQASQSLEIVWKNETTLIMRNKMDSDMMQSLVRAMGELPGDQMDSEAAESLRKVQEKLEMEKVGGEVAGAHIPNKFFDRSKH